MRSVYAMRWSAVRLCTAAPVYTAVCRRQHGSSASSNSSNNSDDYCSRSSSHNSTATTAAQRASLIRDDASATLSSSSLSSSSPLSTRQEPSYRTRHTTTASAASSSSPLSPVTVTAAPSSRRPLRVRRRPPWGAMQLRDMWGDDAMPRRDTEGFTRRMLREHRYHPRARLQRLVGYVCVAIFCAMLLFICVLHYMAYGQPIWRGDKGRLLRMLKGGSVSPRSALYHERLPETMVLPAHVLHYRHTHPDKRARDELVFQITGSAFATPNADVLRQVEATLARQCAA